MLSGRIGRRVTGKVSHLDLTDGKDERLRVDGRSKASQFANALKLTLILDGSRARLVRSSPKRDLSFRRFKTVATELVRVGNLPA